MEAERDTRNITKIDSDLIARYNSLAKAALCKVVVQNVIYNYTHVLYIHWHKQQNGFFYL